MSRGFVSNLFLLLVGASLGVAAWLAGLLEGNGKFYFLGFGILVILLSILMRWRAAARRGGRKRLTEQAPPSMSPLMYFGPPPLFPDALSNNDDLCAEEFILKITKEQKRPAIISYRPYPPPDPVETRSRIGGFPDLPEGTPWPCTQSGNDLYDEGVPLHFVAQIDLEQLPLHLKGCPEKGTLLFFARLDEGMIWDTPGLDPRNDVRVLYDPRSNGVWTCPPPEIEAISGGRNPYDENFSLPGKGELIAFPEWPLVFSDFQTLPEHDSLPTRAPNEYLEFRKQFYHDQLSHIFPSISTSDRIHLGEFLYSKTGRKKGQCWEQVLRPHSETGFPFSPVIVRLICKFLLAKQASDKKAAHRKQVHPHGGLEVPDPFLFWLQWADAQDPSYLDPMRAENFLNYLNELLSSEERTVIEQRVKNAVSAAIREAVKRSGGDPQLRALLPREVFVAEWGGRHPVLIDGKSCRIGDGLLTGPSSVTYHQMFGHPSSVQYGGVEADERQLLLQVFSDYGSNMILCDVGEINFFISAADLQEANFDKVFGTTCGG